jgi:hypothetical protein
MRSLAVAVCSKLLTWAMSPELLHRAALVGWGGHRWRSGRGKIAPAAHLEAGLRQQRGTEKGLSRSEYAKGLSASRAAGVRGPRHLVGGRTLQATNRVPALAAPVAAAKERPFSTQAGQAIMLASSRFRPASRVIMTSQPLDAARRPALSAGRCRPSVAPHAPLVSAPQGSGQLRSECAGPRQCCPTR